VKEQILSSFVRLIATTPELQPYSVRKLYAALKEDVTQEGLTLAATWVIGEYGDALLRGASGEIEDEEISTPPRESEVVDLFGTILNSSYSGQVVTQYIITSAVKLTTRLSDAAQVERIHRLLRHNQTNLDVEIQQRTVEYSNLFSHSQIMKGVLEKMPPPEIREEQRVLGEAPKKHSSGKKSKKPSQITEQDLLGLVDSGEPSITTTNGTQNNADLLMDILGGSNSAPTSSQSPAAQQKSNVDAIMGLFGSSSTTSPPPASTVSKSTSASADLLGGFSGSAAPVPSSTSPAPPPAHEAFNRNGLQVTFQLQRTPQAIQAVARFRNVGGSKLSSVTLQAAVPRTQKLQLQSISESEISPGQEATQLLKVTGVNGVGLSLRLCASDLANCIFFSPHLRD
jgi:AP-1 complex subunit gamma-1